MAWFERMMERIGYTATAKAAARSVPLSRAQAARVVVVGGPVYPEHGTNFGNALEFSWRHPYLFACCNAISTSAMGVPVRVLRLVPDEATLKAGHIIGSATASRCQKMHSHFESAAARQTWLHTKGLAEEEVPDTHELIALLDQVSPVSTWGEHIYKTMFHLEAAGNAYWELVGGEEGKPPKQLSILRPDRMSIVPDAKTVVGAYVLTVNGREIKFAPDEVLHFRYPHPMDDFYGLARTATLDHVLNTDWARYKYARNFFERGAHLSYALMPEAGVEMNQDEYERLMEKFEGDHVGVDNSHKGIQTHALGGMKIEKLGENPRDADFLRMADRHDMEIAAVTGVPTPKFKSKDVNRSNYEAAQLQFWAETMTPKLSMAAGMMNEFLCPRYGPDIVVEFDLSGIEILSDAEDAVITRESLRFNDGSITIDEYREATGSEAWPKGGDVVKRSIGDKYVVPGEEEKEPEPVAPPPPPPVPPVADEEGEAADEEADAQARAATVAVQKGVDFGSSEHQKAIDAFEGRVRPFEATLLERVEAWAEDLRDEVLAKFEVGKALKASMPDPDFLFDVDAQGALLWTEVAAVSEEAMAAEGRRVLATLTVEGMTFDPEAPRVLGYLQRKELLVKTVAKDLHEDLRQTIIGKVRAGAPISEIADVVERRFEGLRDWQAKRIAQTETIGAMNVGGMSAIEQAGIETKQWIATLDDRVRDTHAMAMGEGEIPTGQAFENGLQHPGDPGAPAREVVNCRCTIAAGIGEAVAVDED